MEVPIMLILPELNNLQQSLPNLGLAVVRALVFLLVMVYGGSRIIPFLLKRIAQWNSRELFIIAVMALGLGVGYVTFLFRLSFAFGAFIAGMVLSESEYSHPDAGALAWKPARYADAGAIRADRRTEPGSSGSALCVAPAAAEAWCSISRLGLCNERKRFEVNTCLATAFIW
jgi:hypothetical protein